MFEFLSLQLEIQKCVAEASHERGARIVQDFCEQHPDTAELIRLAFTGTPAQAREQFLMFFPSLGPVLSVEFVGRVQDVLLKEWNKKR